MISDSVCLCKYYNITPTIDLFFTYVSKRLVPHIHRWYHQSLVTHIGSKTILFNQKCVLAHTFLHDEVGNVLHWHFFHIFCNVIFYDVISRFFPIIKEWLMLDNPLQVVMDNSKRSWKFLCSPNQVEEYTLKKDKEYELNSVFLQYNRSIYCTK